MITTLDDVRAVSGVLIDSSPDYVDDPMVFAEALGIDLNTLQPPATLQDLPSATNDFLCRNGLPHLTEVPDAPLATGAEIAIALAVLVILQTKVKLKRNFHGQYEVEITKGTVHLDSLIKLLPFLK